MITCILNIILKVQDERDALPIAEKSIKRLPILRVL